MDVEQGGHVPRSQHKHGTCEDTGGDLYDKDKVPFRSALTHSYTVQDSEGVYQEGPGRD